MTEGADLLKAELDLTGLSEADAHQYVAVIQRAVDVHVEREKIRHGLWKRYPALDQVRQAKIKIERMYAALEHAALEGTDIPVIDLTEEAVDIINYTVFAARILRNDV